MMESHLRIYYKNLIITIFMFENNLIILLRIHLKLEKNIRKKCQINPSGKCYYEFKLK